MATNNSTINTKHYLGTLCKRGHDYQGTGMSLRFRSGGACIECHQSTDRRWNQEHPEVIAKHRRRAKEKQAHRNGHLLRNYGITRVEYDDMFARQGGVCAICGQPETTKRKLLHVDHDHVTGKNRQLLCFGCNSGLGGFKEDVELLQKAIEYLKFHKSTFAVTP